MLEFLYIERGLLWQGAETILNSLQFQFSSISRTVESFLFSSQLFWSVIKGTPQQQLIKHFLVDFFSNTILGLFTSVGRSAWNRLIYILSLLSKPSFSHYYYYYYYYLCFIIFLITIIILVLQRLKNLPHSARSWACLPFTKSFRKMRLESKWNTTFWVGSNGTSQKLVLFFRTECSMQTEICVPFLQSQLWYQF